MQTILSTSQIETRLGDIYSTAYITKPTSAELHERLNNFLAELCERTPGGRRRYSVETIGYARGYARALDNQIMREQVEFVYRSLHSGYIYSTHKQSTHKSTEEFYEKGEGALLGEMEAAHVWKGTDKPFTPWSVPNQDMRDRQAVALAKSDSRYSVQSYGLAFNGKGWAFLWLDKVMGSADTEAAAWLLAAKHKAERDASLSDPVAQGWKPTNAETLAEVQRVVAAIGRDTLVADVYDERSQVSDALARVPGFEYPDWSHLTMGEAETRARKILGGDNGKG